MITVKNTHCEDLLKMCVSFILQNEVIIFKHSCKLKKEWEYVTKMKRKRFQTDQPANWIDQIEKKKTPTKQHSSIIVGESEFAVDTTNGKLTKLYDFDIILIDTLIQLLEMRIAHQTNTQQNPKAQD